jgi:hypothetical protein
MTAHDFASAAVIVFMALFFGGMELLVWYDKRKDKDG